MVRGDDECGEQGGHPHEGQLWLLDRDSAAAYGRGGIGPALDQCAAAQGGSAAGAEHGHLHRAEPGQIGAHRGKRSASIAKNPLDEIGGIGPARKRALLDRFGSARGVSRAALAELEVVDGVNKELAKRIYDFFHDTKR
jgi:hypothetical protein